MTNTATKEENHGLDQAKAQLRSIIEMVEALNDAKRIDRIAGDCENEIEEAQRRIQEDPLSVEVRSDWHSPAAADYERHISEYRILLCTGGPAVQIIGELSQFGEPESARLQHQDWFKPWTDYPLTKEEEESVLQYAQQFYFGQ